MRDGRAYTLDIKRSMHASLTWDAEQLGEEEAERPPGHDDACWYERPRLLNAIRRDTDAARELAVMTCARWHNGWLAQITYIDVPKGSGSIAAAIDTGTELTFADKSVRADEPDVTMRNEVIDGHFFRACERAQCRPYIGEAHWPSHRLHTHVYARSTCVPDGDKYPTFATRMLCHELRLTSIKPSAGHPTLFVQREAIRLGPRIIPPTETTVDGDAPSCGKRSFALGASGE